MMPATAEHRPTNEDRIRAALWFAEHGFKVFSCWSTDADGTCRCPAGAGCDSPGKHPVATAGGQRHGFKDATLDPKAIRTLLSAGSDPNYGLVCPDGVFALDVDGDGVDRLAGLEARLGALPPTLRTDTANGQHIFLRWPDDHPRPVGQMLGYIARWGSGKAAGYVIGPRSVHRTGREYRPSGVAEIATLPEAWAKAVVGGDPSIITIRPMLGDATDVHAGGRHFWLRDTARLYAGTVRDPEALYAAVWAANVRLDEPKTEAEVRQAIGDVLAKFPADEVERDEDTGEMRVVRGDDGIGLLSPRDDSDLFPAAPGSVAFDGPLGEAALHLAGGTDASEVALLASLVAFCGALMPAHAYFHGNQTSSPFLALVGHTGDGRKGTAMYRARDALGLSLGTQIVNRTPFDGVASGEGLVKALHDRGKAPSGVLFEEEYATFLAASGRDGSTLDTRMRAAFDGSQLSNRKVADTLVVEAPYWLSGLVAITPAELQERVPRGSFKSGSGNRWLWLPVRRRDVVVRSTPPTLPGAVSGRLLEAHRRSLAPRTIEVSTEVDELLAGYDRFLRANAVGLEADMTRRYTVIAFRIALVHASVDVADEVSADHAERAIALTEYARRGMEWVFGAALGDGASTLLLRQLQEEGSLSSGTISKYLIRDPIRRQAAVDELCRLGLATVERVPTTGRKRTELRLTARNGDFRDFRALITNRPKTTASVPEHDHEGAEVRGSARKGAVERDTDRAEGARKGAEVVELVDRETGQVGDTVHVRCSDPRAHYRSIRNTPEGWVCDACKEEEEAT